MIPNFTFSHKDAPRLDLATGYVDWFAVRKRSCVLLSLFGYNSGAAQFIHLFDAGNGAPTGTITKADESSWDEGQLPSAGHGLQDGDKVVITDIAGIAAGILFAHSSTIGSNAFSVHATLADAMTGANPDIPDAGDDGGTFTHVPLHTFAIGAQDNYSVIVPRTGINFSSGLVVAVSTTGPLYTAGAKEATMCGTLIA